MGERTSGITGVPFGRTELSICGNGTAFRAAEKVPWAGEVQGCPEKCSPCFLLSIGAAREAATVPDKIVCSQSSRSRHSGLSGRAELYFRIGGPGKFWPVSAVVTMFFRSKIC